MYGLPNSTVLYCTLSYAALLHRVCVVCRQDGFGEAQLTLHSVRESRLARLSSRLKKSLNSSSRLSLGGSSTDDSDTETSEQATTEAAQRQVRAGGERSGSDRTPQQLTSSASCAPICSACVPLCHVRIVHALLTLPSAS